MKFRYKKIDYPRNYVFAQRVVDTPILQLQKRFLFWWHDIRGWVFASQEEKMKLFVEKLNSRQIKQNELQDYMYHRQF